MSLLYFIVSHTDVTQNMLDRSQASNIYTLRKSKPTIITGAYDVILKYDPGYIPVELATLGYAPLSQDALLEVFQNESSKWLSEDI